MTAGTYGKGDCSPHCTQEAKGTRKEWARARHILQNTCPVNYLLQPSPTSCSPFNINQLINEVRHLWFNHLPMLGSTSWESSLQLLKDTSYTNHNSTISVLPVFVFHIFFLLLTFFLYLFSLYVFERLNINLFYFQYFLRITSNKIDFLCFNSIHFNMYVDVCNFHHEQDKNRSIAFKFPFPLF